MSAHALLIIIINSLYKINYTVIAVTCDMGSTNMKLWNKLNIGLNIDAKILTLKTYRKKPFRSKIIFYILQIAY